MKAAQRVRTGYWWFRRPVTLGALGMVINTNQQVLLVRHTYRPGWYLPGGGVKKGESFYTALERELFEEVGVTTKVFPHMLHGIFYSTRENKHDHAAVFIVTDFERPHDTTDRFEIAEAAWFSFNSLPDSISPGTLRRLQEYFQKVQTGTVW